MGMAEMVPVWEKANLTLEEVGRRYSPQIASRLMGEFYSLHFFGDDIRLMKKK